MWTLTSLETFWRDFTYAYRTLTKTSGFTSVMVVTRALGISASAAMVSVLESVLIGPSSYPDAKRFMTGELHNASRSESPGRAEHFAPASLDYAEKSHGFDLVIAEASEGVSYSVGAGVKRLSRSPATELRPVSARDPIAIALVAALQRATGALACCVSKRRHSHQAWHGFAPRVTQEESCSYGG